MLWDGHTTPIKTNIQPGWPVVTTTSVKAPDYPGQYVLVWDLMIDDKWLSTETISHGGDILPVFVEVTGGKLAFADLSKLMNVVAESPDTARTTGDFDGAGDSYPAELMPPDAGVSDECLQHLSLGLQLDAQESAGWPHQLQLSGQGRRRKHGGRLRRAEDRR